MFERLNPLIKDGAFFQSFDQFIVLFLISLKIGGMQLTFEQFSALYSLTFQESPDQFGPIPTFKDWFPDLVELSASGFDTPDHSDPYLSYTDQELVLIRKYLLLLLTAVQAYPDPFPDHGSRKERIFRSSLASSS